MIAPTDRTYLKFMTYRRGCDDPGESAATTPPGGSTPSTSSLTPASLEDVDLGIDDDQEGPRAATSRDLRESEAFASDARRFAGKSLMSEEEVFHTARSNTPLRVPRVPTATTTTAALERTANRQPSAKNVDRLNRTERLLQLLSKIATREDAFEHRTCNRRAKELVSGAIDQESPLLFYAHLAELSASLRGPGLSQRDLLAQSAAVLDAISSALRAKTPRSASGSGEGSGSEGGVTARGLALLFSRPAQARSQGQRENLDATKIRALLCLESLTHNAPEAFSEALLRHGGIVEALEFICTAYADPADAVQGEARAVAGRLLDWAEYAKSEGGQVIRRWCERNVDALYLERLRALHGGQVAASCSLCQMSKWEWLADVEEAVVTIQSHFRSYRVRREIAKRGHYGMDGPFTSRVFPGYRRDHPAIEERTRLVGDDVAGVAGGKVHPLDLLPRAAVQRRTTTSSSISTVGESLMSKLPLELGERAAYNFVGGRGGARAAASPENVSEILSPQSEDKGNGKFAFRATDSDYDSGTEYAASSRVKVNPSRYLRHSRRVKREGGQEAAGRVREHLRRLEAAATPSPLGKSAADRAACGFPFGAWDA